MISFRARGPSCPEWDDLTFSGENEELLAHQVSSLLRDSGWEFLVERDGEEVGELEWEEGEDD